jgi:tyrosinase
MSGFSTAGLDPIFWLHHCNIDRLWSVWRNRAPGNVDPTEPEWLTAIPFEFNQANGQVVTMTCSQVTDTTAPPLSYEYEDISDPLGGFESVEGEEGRPSMRKRPIPEMVGATHRPLTLAGEAATTKVPVSQPTGPASSEEAIPAPRRIHLNIENITSAGQPGSYTVYINLPAGAKPEDHPELYAGLLPMFGVEESTDASRPHPASGLTYRLDITNVVGVLESKNDWNPDEMRVTFVPEHPKSDLEGITVIAPAPVQVGRVSLYYS